MGKVVNTYYSGISFSSDSRKWLFKIIYIIFLVKVTSLFLVKISRFLVKITSLKY